MRFRGQSVGAETTVDHTSMMEDVLEQEMVLYAVIAMTVGLVDASQTMMVPSFVEVAGTMVTS